MNPSRPLFRPLSPARKPVEFTIEAGLCSTPPGDTVHAIFAPLHYESGYSYPLIVWLHGRGSDQRQLMRVMPLVSMRNYVAVAPRGPLQPASDAGGEVYDWEQSDDRLAEAQQRIFDSIDSITARFNVAAHRVFLAGFDTGGTMAFRVAMNFPDRFAGVLSLGGAFPMGCTALANLSLVRRVPIFLAAGRGSEIYPQEAVCADLRLLHTAGLSITLRSYPCGHELSPQMLADVDRWIIDQITGPHEPVASDHQWSREAE
jgi:phospholipase/carboxylesterase